MLKYSAFHECVTVLTEYNHKSII